MSVTSWLFTVAEVTPGAAALLAPDGVAVASTNYPGAHEFASVARSWDSPHWADVSVLAVGDADADVKAQQAIDARRAENAAMVGESVDTAKAAREGRL